MDDIFEGFETDLLCNGQIYLAMEEKDPDGQKTAFSLMTSFPKAFRSIQFTVHPTGVTGESQGKSSNISWAARQASRKYVDEKARRNCIITVMDGQSHDTRRSPLLELLI